MAAYMVGTPSKIVTLSLRMMSSARAGSNRGSRVSVAAEATGVARASQRGHRLTLVASPDPVIVSADRARLRQVIDNLISNAFQHTPAGTLVVVAVDAVSGHGQLLVTDNGPGMMAEQASRVFERFYRTDQSRSRARGGTGLGLSIVAALVHAHQGTIAVETRPGHGAAFRVRLPLATARGTSAAPPASTSAVVPDPA